MVICPGCGKRFARWDLHAGSCRELEFQVRSTDSPSREVRSQAPSPSRQDRLLTIEQIDQYFQRYPIDTTNMLIRNQDREKFFKELALLSNENPEASALYNYLVHHFLDPFQPLPRDEEWYYNCRPDYVEIKAYLNRYFR